MRKSLLLTMLISIAALSGSSPCAAQSGKAISSSEAQNKQETTSPAHSYFTDVPLVNQDGKGMRFYSDLIKGKVVIINAFFTTCQGVCPVMAHNLEAIQQAVGDRLGQDVHIISISVDPETDTPAVLKDFAKKFHARPGWYFITGKKEDVSLALRKLGQHVEVRENHTNILIIGNEPTGLWKKALGMAKAVDLVNIVKSVMDDKPGEQR